jgi:hypothetical protein
MKILPLMTVKKTIFKDKQTRVKSFQNLTTQMFNFLIHIKQGNNSKYTKTLSKLRNKVKTF